MSAIVTHRSMVNLADCDEMGHMNVRHYVGKADLATAHLANALGLGPNRLQESGWRLRTADHHVRFHRELRAGTGLYIQSFILVAAPAAIRVCHEIRKTLDQSVSATITGDLHLVEKDSGRSVSFPTQACDRARERMLPLPEYAAPRGLFLPPPSTTPTLAQADAAGLFEIYRSVVLPMQCDSHGYMLPANVIASISDGIPNIFNKHRGETAGRPNHEVGGAAVEYRLFHRRSCPAGTLIAIRSGILAIGEKTMRHGHWLFDVETGELIALGQAIAVIFDLVARRAMAVPEQARRHYETLLRPGVASPWQG